MRYTKIPRLSFVSFLPVRRDTTRLASCGFVSSCRGIFVLISFLPIKVSSFPISVSRMLAICSCPVLLPIGPAYSHGMFHSAHLPC